MKVSDAIQHLKGYGPEDHIAMPIWETQDVFTRAEQQEKRLNQATADEIVDEVDRQHNAEYGISWDTLDDGIIRLAVDMPDACQYDGSAHCPECKHSNTTCLAANQTFEEE